jgi:hypothetical protein
LSTKAWIRTRIRIETIADPIHCPNPPGYFRSTAIFIIFIPFFISGIFLVSKVFCLSFFLFIYSHDSLHSFLQPLYLIFKFIYLLLLQSSAIITIFIYLSYWYLSNKQYVSLHVHFYLDHGLLLQLEQVQLEIMTLPLFEAKQEKQWYDQNLQLCMRSSRVVRASESQCQSRYKPWVQFKHSPTQWNLRANR